MTADDRRALRDPELVELLAGEPELLAIVDAYAATQDRYWRRSRLAIRARRLGLIAIVVAAIAVPAVAFAAQIGQLLGLSNSGTAVPTSQIPAQQLSALESIGFPVGQVRLLAHRAGVGFYAARTRSDGYCFAIGLSNEAKPSIDALACQDGSIGSFPSAHRPRSGLLCPEVDGGGDVRNNASWIRNGHRRPRGSSRRAGPRDLFGSCRGERLRRR